MAGSLNSSNFLKIQNLFKERCVTLFIEAYYTSISNRSVQLDFEENDITKILNHYIDQNLKRKEWKISSTLEYYLFDEEVRFEKGFAAKSSRIDLRFTSFWQQEEFKYYIEAKNLKSNDSALKRRYISTGINNFLKGGKYFSCDGFLVGYILEGTVEHCVNGINKLLLKDGRSSELLEEKITLNLVNSHFSKHQEKEILHLFLNYID
ncbi:hypothetical protein B0A78_01825 [Flavobacterium columnare NBRC 100251 = ATCC 23463]|uniref:hypothetical protein n=1 Tax=Flavobacterium columnare TaxID=996 RepID=UPI0007F9CFE3|nr:hypothetical protein [Flavobacterium columnare]ANO47136.1 hypothetical protein Pf1_01679 [Flavobacterium columnare]APT22181.1 hypothetical protein BU993_05755 [Flavobacterium columnare]PDS26587.1 hypothetical protein B0A78_01825 [Flavobacterium columnare NBRC 100251 = ATCC 23463]PTD14215.1 hypothetical protein C6N29_07115 [Flavobacterium columnare]GEM58463.1 hypothetical protein FC1_17010 [Flavobacterium columnare NBRC 100251 = ATCC 23463]